MTHRPVLLGIVILALLTALAKGQSSCPAGQAPSCKWVDLDFGGTNDGNSFSFYTDGDALTYYLENIPQSNDSIYISVWPEGSNGETYNYVWVITGSGSDYTIAYKDPMTSAGVDSALADTTVPSSDELYFSWNYGDPVYGSLAVYGSSACVDASESAGCSAPPPPATTQPFNRNAETPPNPPPPCPPGPPPVKSPGPVYYGSGQAQLQFDDIPDYFGHGMNYTRQYNNLTPSSTPPYPVSGPAFGQADSLPYMRLVSSSSGIDIRSVVLGPQREVWFENSSGQTVDITLYFGSPDPFIGIPIYTFGTGGHAASEIAGSMLDYMSEYDVSDWVFFWEISYGTTTPTDSWQCIQSDEPGAQLIVQRNGSHVITGYEYIQGFSWRCPVRS